MFPIQMTFTVSTPAELAKLVAATTGETVPKTGTNVPKKGTPDPQSEKPAATQAAAAQAASTGSATASPSEGNAHAAASAAQPAATESGTTTEPTAAASGLDYDKDVKPAFLKLVQTKGRAAGRKIIDAFAPTKEKLSEAITTQEQYKQALDLIAKELA